MDAWAVKYQLLNSSAEYVFEWLKSKSNEENELPDFISDDREVLECALLARGDDLINLGLAFFCLSPLVGFQLYKNGDYSIKRAALSGLSVKRVLGHEEWVLESSALPEIISRFEEGNSDDDFNLIRAAISNKNIPDEVLL